MKKFKLKSKYSPAGDQGKAIAEMGDYLDKGYDWQTLWGVTGS
jgi:excinuclease ABC subunit B